MSARATRFEAGSQMGVLHMTNTHNTPADWYPDPSGRHEYRYWDGTAWTEYVSDRGVRSTDQRTLGRRAQPVHKSPASTLLVGGLWKYLLWGPIVAGGGAGIYSVGLLTGDPLVWVALGGLIVIVGAIISIAGIVQLIQGVGMLAAVFEVAARASLEPASAPREDWPPPPSAPSQRLTGSPLISQHPIDDNPDARGEGETSLQFLTAHPQLAEQAQKIRRMYGDDVCASFLTRKASELGLGDVKITADDLPDKR